MLNGIYPYLKEQKNYLETELMPIILTFLLKKQ
ncbi:hypothetical protein IMAU30025_01605 [Lactobacillus helveticus]|nr:hypothetical protein [Lactobacillus helveticus]